MTNTQPAALSAEIRENMGTGAARAIRRAGNIPAVRYAGGKAPAHLSLNANELTQRYMKGRFQNKLVELDLGKEGKVKALPQDVQLHPVTDRILHVDFLKVEKGSTLRVKVPVRFTGKEKCVGIKLGGVLNIVRHEVEFICDPESIPDFIEVDILDMHIGDSRHIGAIELPAGIKPVIDRDFTIATISGRAQAIEEEDAEAAANAAAAAEAEAAKADDAKKDESK